MNDVARLLAHQEIHQLAHRYAAALDARDLDTLVGLFSEDVQVGRNGRGRAALRRDFDRQLRAVGVTILQVGTQVIDLHDEDHAGGIVYCRGEIETDGRLITQAIRYQDDYARVDGKWYFVRRRHELWYGAGRDEDPLALPPANWPEHATGRGTLPESLASWQRFWNKKEED